VAKAGIREANAPGLKAGVIGRVRFLASYLCSTPPGLGVCYSYATTWNH